MHYIKKKFSLFKENQVTSENIFLNRRKFIIGLSLSFSLPNSNLLGNIQRNNLESIIDRELTSFDNISKYNNFFEFGTTKKIWKQAQKLDIENWKISVSGANFHSKTIPLESILRNFSVEERIYKFRCVEAWSMVVPWTGFELSKLVNFLKPKSNTRFVEFETFYKPEVATNQKQDWYPWPYKEIITIEEAMNPLSFIATGVYGRDLPKQNGAPLRLVLPWKYGFKSIKSISKIKFTNSKSKSFWEKIAPKEYGFWANVNPNFPHRRWSQEYEKDIETGLKYPTKLFNGYERWVSSLYPNLENRLFFY